MIDRASACLASENIDRRAMSENYWPYWDTGERSACIYILYLAEQLILAVACESLWIPLHH
jgi:hypothetical protein